MSLRIIGDLDVTTFYNGSCSRCARQAYFRETGNSPILNASVDLDAEHGALESHNGKHFIFLHPVIVDNYVLDDVCPTIIHEILHILYHNDEERNIRDMEKAICEQFDIKLDQNKAHNVPVTSRAILAHLKGIPQVRQYKAFVFGSNCKSLPQFRQRNSHEEPACPHIQGYLEKVHEGKLFPEVTRQLALYDLKKVDSKSWWHLFRSI